MSKAKAPAAARAKRRQPERSAPVRPVERGEGERYRSTFSQAAVGIMHTTTEGAILEANRCLCAMLGYSSAELRALNTRDLTHPEDRDRQDDQRLELLAGFRNSFSSDKRYVRKDGTPIWVNRTVALGYETPGADPYLIHTIEDITERKRAEQALAQSQTQYAALVDSLDSIVWEADARTFQFTFVSRQAEKLLGYPVERWLAEPTFWQDHIHPEDRDWAVAYCITATAELRSHDFEYRMIAADGRVVWLRDIVNVVAENGRPVRSRGVMVDITDGKKSELDSRRYARASRVLAECSHALVVHATDEAALLSEMCRIVVESGGYVQAHIGFAADDERKMIRAVAWAGYEAGYFERKNLDWGGDGLSASLTARVIATGERYISRDVLTDANARHLAERAHRRGFQSMIGLPLTIEESCIGAISIYAREQNAFDDEEVALLATLAADISYGISVVRARAAQKQAATELARATRARRVLAECRHAQMHAANEAVLVAEMCRIAVESGGYKQAWIGLPTGNPVLPVFPVAFAGYESSAPMTTGTNWAADGRYLGLAGEALAAGDVRIVRDILNDPQHVPKRGRALELGYQSSIALPLRSEGAALGVLVLHATERDAFDGDEITLLDELADDVAFGIAALRSQAARSRMEQRLRESEQRVREVFDQAAVGIARSDLDGRIVEVNQKFCDMLGYARDELLGRTVRDITHPDDYGKGAKLRAKLKSGVRIGQESGEKRFMRKDGSPLWTKRTFSAAYDEAGTPKYVTSVVEDITERNEATERYRVTFENAPVGIMHTALERGRILHVNARLCDMLGYSQEELLGMVGSQFTDPGYIGKDQAYQERMLRNELDTFASERLYRRKDGSPLWVRRTASLARNAAGKPLYFIRIIEDITARKDAEEQIARERALLRTVVDALPDRIYAKDRDGRFLLQNAANVKAHGAASHEELLGKTAYDVFPPEVARRVEAEDRAIIDSGRPLLNRERAATDDSGNTRWVLTSKVPLRDAGGNVIGVIGVNRDVTERTVAARSRAMEHAVTKVLAEAMSVHEALPRLISTMCEAMEWTYGARWAWDDAEDSLVRREFWSDFVPEFAGDDETPWIKLRFKHPGGLLRSAWFEKRPTWIADIEREEGFNRKGAALKFGLRSAFSFPIISGTNTIGVMEFFGPRVRQPDDMLLQISASIGRQVGQFMQRQEAEEARRQSEQQFRQLAGHIPQAFWMTDIHQKQLIYVSPAYQEISGRPMEQVTGDPRSLLDAVHPDDRTRVTAARRQAVTGNYDEMFRLVRPDGAIRWIHDRAFPVEDETGAAYRIAGIAEDVTERKMAEEQLLNLAHYDVLTALPNRVLFYDRLKQSLAQAKRNQWIVGVMFIDVDRFKNVNDTLGHAVGDKLLQQVAQRLTGAVRADDTVGRLGGDEFAIVLTHLATSQDANVVAQKIMASFNEPFRLDGAEVFVTGSIGITLFPDDSAEQDTLIKNADAAMYRAKELGRNSYQFYTPEMNARALELLGMESNLRRALERNEFLLHFQPKANVATGEILGVEALLRWNHPERGMVPPADFIRVMEETGLIVPAGEWVLKAVCEQIKSWEAAGIKPAPVAVNLSARQFLAKDLGPTIKRILDSQRVDPALIELEITESSLMSNTAESVDTLEYLSGLGLSVSIDDFGTGYSSLAYLKRFPLDALKIDRSFVRDITTDADDANITRAIISMAHSLGLKVIAEGVETEAQAAFLADYGCDQIQGYYLTPPLAADDYVAWLVRRGAPKGLLAADDLRPAVLLVDDEEIALVLGKRALGKDGYQVHTANNAHEAFELLGQHRIDVVVSDHHMPGISGIEFLVKVKTLFPDTVRMMLSGIPDIRIAAEAVSRAEVFRFLPKGVSDDRLRAEVGNALRSRAGSGLVGTAGAPKESAGG